MPISHRDLTSEQVEALGRELDELRNRVIAGLGERDADYIRNVIRAQRALELTGRGLLFAGFLPPACGSAASSRCRCRRSSTTWRSATT
jgi:hypothetical protein